MATNESKPLIRVVIAAHRATPEKDRGIDECSCWDYPRLAKRVEYNLFHPAADDRKPLIPLEEADREWRSSMKAEGWPELPPGYFQRCFDDSEDDADEPAVYPEIILRYSGFVAPPESSR